MKNYIKNRLRSILTILFLSYFFSAECQEKGFLLCFNNNYSIPSLKPFNITYTTPNRYDWFNANLIYNQYENEVNVKAGFDAGINWFRKIRESYRLSYGLSVNLNRFGINTYLSSTNSVRSTSSDPRINDNNTLINSNQINTYYPEKTVLPGPPYVVNNTDIQIDENGLFIKQDSTFKIKSGYNLAFLSIPVEFSKIIKQYKLEVGFQVIPKTILYKKISHTYPIKYEITPDFFSVKHLRVDYGINIRYQLNPNIYFALGYKRSLTNMLNLIEIYSTRYNNKSNEFSIGLYYKMKNN